jgi:hypothetical protein
MMDFMTVYNNVYTYDPNESRILLLCHYLFSHTINDIE